MLQSALALRPDSIEVIEHQARALIRMGQHDHAAWRYRRVLELQPNWHPAWLKLGVQYLALGRSAEALDAFDHCLALAPQNALAWCNRGIALGELRESAQALESFDKAVALEPGNAEIWANRGKACNDLEWFDEGLESYDQALERAPALAFAWTGKAACLNGLERYEDALLACERALALDANDAMAWNNRGIACSRLDLAAEGLESLDRALAIVPGDPLTWNNRATTLIKLKRFDEALVSTERALALAPQLAAVRSNRARTLLFLKRVQEALDEFDVVLRLYPNNAEALRGKAQVLIALRRYALALECLDQAIAFDGRNVEGWVSRGQALVGLGDFAGGIAALDVALEQESGSWLALASQAVAWGELGEQERAQALFAQARAKGGTEPVYWDMLGSSLAYAGDYAAALSARQTACELAPYDDELHWNRALLLLLLGRYAEGWAAYECRRRLPELRPRTPVPAPQWDGADPAGKDIVLVWEQGYGDTLQFCRYATVLAERGARVSLMVQTPLRGLIESLHPQIRVLAQDALVEHADLQCPLMSLPYLLAENGEQRPYAEGYLHAPSSAAARWAAQLGAPSVRRIGLAFSGNPEHGNDRNRSLPLARLAPLLQDHGEWHLLQKDVRETDAGQLHTLGIHDHRATLADFSDTAGLIAALDLVVTVDTSLVHLAGALGKPVWLLLPANPDWRWLLDRNDSPWYASLRIFRQTRAGDWDGVLREVAQALRALDA